jgi:hypothetical protein
VPRHRPRRIGETVDAMWTAAWVDPQQNNTPVSRRLRETGVA